MEKSRFRKKFQIKNQTEKLDKKNQMEKKEKAFNRIQKKMEEKTCYYNLS